MLLPFKIFKLARNRGKKFPYGARPLSVELNFESHEHYFFDRCKVSACIFTIGILTIFTSLIPRPVDKVAIFYHHRDARVLFTKALLWSSNDLRL